MLSPEPAVGAPGRHVAAEYALLSVCLQAEWTPARMGEVRYLVACGIDWERFDTLAAYHLVRPRVYHSLLEICPEALPEATLAEYVEVQRAADVRNRFLARELHRVLEHLQRHDVPALSFKGPLLARTIYGAYRQRRSNDLDVLIPPSSAQAAEECLAEIGYRRARLDASPLRWRLRSMMSGQFELMRGADVFVLDIHTRLLPPRYAFDLAFEELWHRSAAGVVGGRTFRLLAPEDHLLILCNHGVKNRWERLSFLCDVGFFVSEHRELEWSGVLRRARRQRGERALCLGVYLAHLVLESPLPEEIAGRLSSMSELGDLARNLARRLPEQPEAGLIGASERFRFHMRAQDTLPARIRYAGFAALRRLWDVVGK